MGVSLGGKHDSVFHHINEVSLYALKVTCSITHLIYDCFLFPNDLTRQIANSTKDFSISCETGP